MLFPKKITKPEEVVGKGVEKIVTGFNEENVIKNYNRELRPEIIKGQFYLAQILHTLYPQSFPNVHTAGKKAKQNERGLSYMIVEKKELDEKHKEMARLLQKTPSQHVGSLSDEDQDAYRALEGEMKAEGRGDKTKQEMGSLGIGFDAQLRNFSVDKDSGDDLYLDTIQAFRFNSATNTYTLNYDKEKLLSVAEGLSDKYLEEKIKARLARLDELFIELTKE
jgi:hypothetical protein